MKKYKNPYLAKWVKGVLHIYDFVYRQNYYFILAKNEKEFRAKIIGQLKKIEFEDEVDFNRSGGFYVCKQNNTPVCFLWASKPEDIIHECFHAVSWVLRNKNVPLTDETEESYAYLLAFLTNQILKHL